MDVYQKAAQFLINVKTKVPREMICRCLILGILVDSSNEISVNATMKAIAVKWQLNVPAVRVSKSLKELVAENCIGKNEKGYFMDSRQKDKYSQSVNNRASFFRSVEDEWLREMQSTGACKLLQPDEIGIIIRDFRFAVEGMCEKHVQELITFLRGELSGLQDVILGKEIMECLPAGYADRTDPIINTELNIFPLFFQNNSDKRAQYCAGMAQAYLRRTIIEVETKGKEIFGNKLKAVVTFLDTNLIFGLLGLHGETQSDSVAKLLELNKNLNVSVLVDKSSIQEYRSVLNISRKNNIGPRVPTRIFGEVKRTIRDTAYKPSIKFALPDDPFVLLFWASLEESFVRHASRRELSERWDRFLTRFEAVEIILSQKYGIKIVNELSKVQYDQDVMDQTTEKFAQAARRRGITKGRAAAEHDALMYFCIHGLRENEKPEILPSNAWLISADKSLGEFHKILKSNSHNELAHFLQVSSWCEVMMPFLSIDLVDEQDKACGVTTALNDSIRYFGVEMVAPIEVAEILRRIPESDENGAELVLRLATDRYFRETIHGIFSGTSAPAKEVIDQGVKKAFEDVNVRSILADKDLTTEVDIISSRLEQTQKDLDVERKARVNAERILSKLKVGTITVLFAGITSWLWYLFIAPTFTPFKAETGLWILGCVGLAAWAILSLRAKISTVRALLLGFLAMMLIFISAAIFKHYADGLLLGILIGAIIATLFAEIALLKTSWLDFKIMMK